MAIVLKKMSFKKHEEVFLAIKELDNQSAELASKKLR